MLPCLRDVQSVPAFLGRRCALTLRCDVREHGQVLYFLLTSRLAPQLLEADPKLAHRGSLKCSARK